MREAEKLNRAPTGFMWSWLKLWGPITVVVVAGFAATPWLIGPPCPKQIVIATGRPDGAYYAFAQRYREIMARDGIDLIVRSTAGSIENAQLLQSGDGGVSLAIMQGGTGTPDDAKHFESLASLYLEPIWVFYRSDQTIERLVELKGKRIAVGAQGSGTRAVAIELLKENGIGPEPDSTTSATMLPWSGRQAADALQRGEIDAAFFVISPRSDIVKGLLHAKGVRLMDFRRAAAYQRISPYLSSVTLSEGTLDLKSNVPPRDVVLLAPTANLVARKDLHPALVPLLLKAVFEVHENGGILEEPGQFPSPLHVEFPLNSRARHFFKSGPSLLYRYLPFQLAAWFDQVKLIFLPLCTLLLPLLKAAPPIYRWRIRSKIYRWYRVLREIDQKLKYADGTSDFSADFAKLKHLEMELSEVSVPLSYMQEFYNLRLHASFVHDKLASLEKSDSQPAQRAA